MNNLNHLNQPVGPALSDWKEPAHPERTVLEGRYCRLEPLSADRHGNSLFEANGRDPEGRNWTYLPYGPFRGLEEYLAWIERSAAATDPLFYAIVDRGSGKAIGVAAYLRIEPVVGCIEVGHLNFSPLLQGKRAATEAMYLMMAHVFRLGYRRYEWKCDALNAPSRRAAQRLGFSFEGIFRQARVVKGRNRDTAWYSIIDGEWPRLNSVFEEWLDSANFDEQGRQRVALSKLTSTVR